jgi:hypothetical protein
LHANSATAYDLAPESLFGMEAEMKTRYLIAVGAVLLAVVGMTIAQQPKIGLTPAGGAGALPPPNDLSAPPGKPTERKPEDMTIEQLLDAVDGFRAQKAEIEKKEKAYMKVVHQKAEKLKQRIDNLDGDKTPPPPVISTTSAPPSIPAPGIGPGAAFPPAGNP